MSAESLPQHESETTQYPFKEVSFGHTLHNFDRDQAITYLLAQLMGLVGRQTPVEFSPYQPTQDLIDNKTTLAIEGIRPSLTRTEARKNIGLNERSFANNPDTDQPAASQLYQRYQRGIKKEDPLRQKLDDIFGWINAVERSKPAPTPVVLRADDLNNFTQVFYAMKYAIEQDTSISDKKAEIMRQLNEIFDIMLADGDRPMLAETYAAKVSTYEAVQDARFEELRKNIIVKKEGEDDINSEIVKYHTTRQGVTVAYVDVSDIDTESGTFGVVANALKQVKGVDAHIVVLVDREKIEDSDEENILVKIKIPKSLKDDAHVKDVDLSELGRRLNQSEALFGNGPEILQNTDYDGHKQIIGSPTVGTKLNPETVFDAVVDYFDYPRYEEGPFAAKADELAKRLGCRTYAVEPVRIPQTEYELAERAVRFNLAAADGTTHIVTISEDEIPVYMQVMGEDVQANQAIVLARNDFSEATEIVRARDKNARADLETYLEQHDGERVLSVLDDLNSASIRALPTDMRLRCLEVIAATPRAIDQVWNKDNQKYNKIHQHVPDWIDGNPEQMQQARFMLISLPRKIDTDLVESLESDLLSDMDPQLVTRYINAMQGIVTADEYKSSHLGEVFDRHLAHMLQLSLNPQVDAAVQTKIIETLRDHFGVEMSVVWRTLGKIEPELMAQIKEHYGKALSLLLPFIEQGTATAVEALQGVIGGYEIRSDINHVLQDLERQRAEGFVPIANILVEIGRPIQKLIGEVGVSRQEKDNKNQWRQEKGMQFAGIIKTTRLMRLDREYSEELKVAEALVNQLVELAQQLPEEVPIRVIRGGCPAILVTYITLYITRYLPEELQNRIIFSDIDNTKNIYEDRKLIPNATPLGKKVFA